MNLDSERTEILKAKNMANKIVKASEERRKWIIDQADVHADMEIKKHTTKLTEMYKSKVYDMTPFEKDLQEHKKTDIENVKAEYLRNESDTVDFLIGHITNVKIEVQKNIKAEYKERQNEKIHN